MTPAAAPAEAILVADDIIVQFDTPEGPITAVDNVSFDVNSGEFLSIIGPSGCGKSTLFNVIGGLLGNYQGMVNVADLVPTFEKAITAVEAGAVVVVDVRVEPGYTAATTAAMTRKSD